MQTFLPYADFAATAAVLDDRRLGKQRVETMQILRALVFPSYRGWKNHPATAMWRGFTPALVAYGAAICREWERRGRADAVRASLLEFAGGTEPDVASLRSAGMLPPWLGSAPFHLSHRSSLLRKEPEHYSRYFADVPDDLPYVWPEPMFPRWPLRRGGRRLSLEAAAAECGRPEVDPAQRDAVKALRAGRDVTLDGDAGVDARRTALLAALSLPGRTLWVSEPPEPDVPTPPLASLYADPVPAVSSRTTPSIARPPTDEDLAAMAGEAATARTGRAEFVFLPRPAVSGVAGRRRLEGTGISLMVFDRVRPTPRVDGAVRLVLP